MPAQELLIILPNTSKPTLSMQEMVPTSILPRLCWIRSRSVKNSGALLEKKLPSSGIKWKMVWRFGWLCCICWRVQLLRSIFSLLQCPYPDPNPDEPHFSIFTASTCNSNDLQLHPGNHWKYSHSAVKPGHQGYCRDCAGDS